MDIKPGLYKHFKGHDVRVIGVFKHTETEEDFVAYEHIGQNLKAQFWIRPLAMFLEEVQKDGKKQPRFTFIKDA